ncbi:DUF4291 family protein [Streptomyces sp. NPDC101234]|uniref:DUF4291 family protein n=1 Tax=Streptomyces sp. NPDC101234 TaxID=3366138 RepID=UPI0038259F54
MAALHGRCHTCRGTGSPQGGYVGVRGAPSVTEAEQGAEYADSTIGVYQAYPQEIAEQALRARRFVAPFRRERMTWATGAVPLAIPW